MAISYKRKANEIYVILKEWVVILYHTVQFRDLEDLVVSILKITLKSQGVENKKC